MNYVGTNGRSPLRNSENVLVYHAGITSDENFY